MERLSKLTVCGGYFDNVFVWRLFRESCLRRCNGRFQQCEVPKAFGASKLSDGFRMDLMNDIECEVEATLRSKAHASFFMVRA